MDDYIFTVVIKQYPNLITSFKNFCINKLEYYLKLSPLENSVISYTENDSTEVSIMSKTHIMSE